ncbi:uncharacterized protein TNCV_1044001 [Trichonephila clavipes]|nr:uncharacterized protein TNCV_1044001 [Trichonephila clavipes]
MQADQWMTPDELGEKRAIYFHFEKTDRYMTLGTQILLRVKTMMFIVRTARTWVIQINSKDSFQNITKVLEQTKQYRVIFVEARILQENCTKKTMNSEKRNKDTGHAVNQIETSISNQNNFLFNELQYVDVIVDDTPLRATLDSGANSVIINSKYVLEGKRIHSQIVLTSCFGEREVRMFQEFTISLKGGERKNTSVSVQDQGSNIVTLESFEFSKRESEEAGSTNASCKPVFTK